MSIDEARYDRQLRLWGSGGQRKLSESRVVCFGSSAVATETLKNLILPGIGSFVVIDDSRVSFHDLENNFFVEKEDVGLSRSEVVVNRLMELNPTIKGTYMTDLSNISSIEAEGSNVVCVIANEWINNLLVIDYVKTVSCRYVVTLESLGFVGRVSLYGQHVVLEPRSEEETISDFMMRNPWPSLQKYINSLDLSPEVDACEFFHIPWLVILAKAYQTGARDRTELLEAISILEGGRSDGLNFQEARDNIYMLTALGTDTDVINSLKESLQTIRETSFVDSTNVVDSIEAVVRFYETHNRLPLSTSSIPDMTSDTKSYTALVALYREKFEADLSEVMTYAPHVDHETVKKVVSNARDLEVLIFPPLYENLDQSVMSPSPKRRAPVSTVEEDCGQFEDPDHQVLVKLLDKESVEESHELVNEFKRYSGELHSVSSIVGAVAAQEIVKLVTNQFIPIDNSFVFNGINGTAFTYRK